MLNRILTIKREQNELDFLNRQAHDGEFCTLDVEGAFCFRCKYLQERYLRFYNGWPTWLINIATWVYLIRNSVKIFRKLGQTISQRGSNNA